MPDKPDARFRERLLEEVEGWRRRGVVGERSYRRILDHYGAAPPTRVADGGANRLPLILGTLGGLLVGIGVILLVASNWEAVPRLAKVGLMTSALVASLGGAYWARFRRRHALLSGALLLLSSLVYGAAIFLVGQAYHLPAGDSRLLLLWGLGGLAMGYAAPSKGVLIVGILATEGWVIEIASQSAESFPLTMLTVLVFGVALLSTGEIHRSEERLRPLSGPYIITGLITIFVSALFLTFSEVWDFFPPSARSFLSPFWVISVLALAATGASALRWRESRPMRLEAGGAAVLVAASVVAGLASSGRSVDVFAPDGSLFHPLLFNAVVAGAAVWAITIGLRTNRDGFVNTALVFIGLLILARYFDFSFRLLDRSIVFIGAGVVLLGTAVGLDRLRRRLTADEETRPEGSR